jgi:hypothetical protein
MERGTIRPEETKKRRAERAKYRRNEPRRIVACIMKATPKAQEKQ